MDVFNLIFKKWRKPEKYVWVIVIGYGMKALFILGITHLYELCFNTRCV